MWSSLISDRDLYLWITWYDMMAERDCDMWNSHCESHDMISIGNNMIWRQHCSFAALHWCCSSTGGGNVFHMQGGGRGLQKQGAAIIGPFQIYCDKMTAKFNKSCFTFRKCANSGRGWFSTGELIIMSANIILEDFIWMLKVLIIVMIHIIATSTHWVLNSRFFRWQQHQENIASQVKFFAEVIHRSNPSQLHSKISPRATQAWQTSL